MSKNIDNFDIYEAQDQKSRSSVGSGSGVSMNVFGDEEAGNGGRFTIGTGANEGALLKAGFSPSSAFLNDEEPIVRPRVDEAVLMKHGIDPSSCLPGDDESSVQTSHIGSVYANANEDGVTPHLSDNGGKDARNIPSSSDGRSKETKKKYALIASIGVLLVVVMVLIGVIATGAKRGREAAAAYSNFNGAQGPPEGIDVTSQQQGGIAPPPGVDVLDEGYEYEEYAGPPSGVDNLEQEQDEEQDGISQSISSDEIQQPDENEGNTQSTDVEEALVNYVEVEDPVFSTSETEVAIASSSLTAPPTSSPTPPPVPNEDEVVDTMDTWNDHVSEGRCFNGMDEALCCFLLFCG